MSGAGKGSKPRKVNFERFSANYDKIFSRNRKSSNTLVNSK
jgi:hypothetical protein